jgi:hypothetical protein
MRRRRTSTSPGTRVAAAAGAAGVVLAGVELARRLTRRLRSRAATAEGLTFWSCACGQRLRMTGSGRHRVYWLAEAPESDPILGHDCPSCGRPLAEDLPLAAAHG